MGSIGVLADVHELEIHGEGPSHGGALGRGQAPQPRACPAQRGTVPLPNRHHVEPDLFDHGIELLALGSDHHTPQCGLDDLDQALELGCQPLALRFLLRHVLSACLVVKGCSRTLVRRISPWRGDSTPLGLTERAEMAVVRW